MLTTENITSFTGEYRFLSNFWPCKIEFRDCTMPSVEHAYVAAKCDIWQPTVLDGLSFMTSGQVKQWGRSHPITENWDSMKFSYMLEFVGKKFHRNGELGELLISTGDALLIEGNTWGDTYWGVCKGKGENNLGKILMKVREEIRSDYK